MIEVKHLTKQYGDKLAVNDISFTVEDGEILGLLGPNGAGKSTTMNMLTGYISSTSGQALINGIDILEDPIKAKAQIGYLPELPPLYLDMTVMGYLNFVYDLKKCKLPRRSHLKDVCNLCRISDVSGRVIKHLSKGYRQRVGLAQALINNPPILILDEPTVGLDPKQIIEIRTLVKKLGKKHTVILSSHILSEVQEVCDRVVIINHGQIAANDTIDNLSKAVSGVNRLVVRISGPKNEVLQAIRAIDDVTKVRADMEREPKIFEFEIEAKPNADIRPALNQMVKEHGWDIYKMDLGVMTLEDAFLKITMGEGVKLSSEKSSAPAAEKSAAPAAETTAPEEPAAAPAEAEKAEEDAPGGLGRARAAHGRAGPAPAPAGEPHGHKAQADPDEERQARERRQAAPEPEAAAAQPVDIAAAEQGDAAAGERGLSLSVCPYPFQQDNHL